MIVGATGNAGTALLRRLRAESDIEVIGVVRRLPDPVGVYAEATWHSIDVGADDATDRLAEVFAGADAVVNLAWQIQPSHDPRALYRTNVLGSRSVARAALRAGVGALVQASSVGAYAPGPKNAYVKESWPRTGVLESSYSRHKALVERMLDEIEADHPTLRVVRLRPGLIFQRAVGTEIARYFAGPLLPARLLRFQVIPLIPAHPGLRMQAVHADDVAEAYVRVLRTDARGGVQHRGGTGARSRGGGGRLSRRTRTGARGCADRGRRTDLVVAAAADRRRVGAPGSEGPADVVRPGRRRARLASGAQRGGDVDGAGRRDGRPRARRRQPAAVRRPGPAGTVGRTPARPAARIG
ncbi:NAD-dependent epimerase/dehydratase family protein [Micromonosporaceae bacterium Da 78-11]